MNSTSEKIQYTVRGIPREVDQALRKNAHDHQISLNQLLVEELSNAIASSAARRYRSLKGLAGKWQDDPEFDRILMAQRQIEMRLWR